MLSAGAVEENSLKITEDVRRPFLNACSKEEQKRKVLFSENWQGLPGVFFLVTLMLQNACSKQRRTKFHLTFLSRMSSRGNHNLETLHIGENQ